MKLLLDTHALLWLVNGDEKLTPAARSEIANPANDLFVSVATSPPTRSRTFGE